MHALVVTVFISLMLVIFFLGLFWQQTRAGEGSGGGGREALLPLEEDEGVAGAAGEEGLEGGAEPEKRECIRGRPNI